MTPEIVVDVFRSALFIVITLVGTLVLPGLLIGLLVAIFQAATSINEQTLSFLPRLIATLATIALLGHWVIATLVEYTLDLIHQIPELIG